MNSRKKYGIVIGRFQVPALHDGHLDLLRHVSDNHDQLVVVLGYREGPPTERNPLPVFVRSNVIREDFPNAKILALPDHRSDMIWSQKLDSLLIGAGCTPDASCIYTGRDGFITAYHTKVFPVVEISSLNGHISASGIRESLLGRVGCIRSERVGMIQAIATLPHRTYETVDIVVWLPDRSAVLMARRADEPLFRFPGGFVEPGETFLAAARRELAEEFPYIMATQFKLEQDFLIDDWRIRRIKGVSHRTMLVSAVYHDGALYGGDDMANAYVTWMPLIPNAYFEVIEEHRPLFQYLLSQTNSPT